MYIDKYEIKIHGDINSDKPIIYLIGEDMIFDEYINIISISGIDWNKELSPWPSKAIFKNGEDFKGEADLFLETLEKKVIPTIEGKQNHIRYLVGYSLAGLFALHTLFKSNVFDGVASVSGSLWYPNFKEYVFNQSINVNKKVYLSLGDKEAKSKNPVLMTVQNNTEDIYHYLSNRCKCYYEVNPGNHFQNANERLKKAIYYLLKNDL